MSGRRHDEHATARPPGRLRPRRLVAIAVAAVLLAGLGGLVVAALAGGVTTSSAHRLVRLLEAGTLPVAPPAGQVRGGEPLHDEPGDEVAPPFAAAPPRSGSASGRRSSDLAMAGPGDPSPVPGDDAVLPPPAPEPQPDLDPPPPVEPDPTAAPTLVPVGAVGAQTLDGLGDWRVHARDDGYVALTDGGVVLEVFVVEASSTDAADVLTGFLDEQLAGAERATVSPPAAQPVPRVSLVSVAGAEYVAVVADQQVTRTMSGSAIAATDGTGSAIVVTTSREGRAAAAVLAGDTALLRGVLERVGTA